MRSRRDSKASRPPGSSRPENEPEPDHAPDRPFPIVGIGASAGGLEAILQLLANLPADGNMAFVLVQHLDPTHGSRLTDILSGSTPMTVVEVTDGMPVVANRFHVIPPNTTMTIQAGTLHLVPRGDARLHHLPIDAFFKSLARDQHSSAIGVILSGNGSDGTQGLAEIKAAGGLAFVQDEDSAKFTGMPLSALASGCVDAALPPDQIADELARISRHPYALPTRAEQGARVFDGAEAEFNRLIGLLRSATGVDFTQYRDTTIRRRILRRMAVNSKETLVDYVSLVESHPSELDALFDDVLINVTSFFRDGATFEALKTTAFPRILEGKTSETPIRVWVAGCSTGEEAYSLAITLLEFLEDKPVRPPLQIFATDLSDRISLARARAGLYPGSIEADVSPERLRRLFVKEGAGYRISKAIRDACIFARHNMTTDPPFSKVDLVSCRNVMIYFSQPLQKRILSVFHYALNPGGFLLLGAAETVSAKADLFGVIDGEHRIYVRKPLAGRQYAHSTTDARPGAQAAALRPGGAQGPSRFDIRREADNIILSRYSPAGIVVNQDLEILQFRGRTSPYLEPPRGEASFSLVKMAREGVFLEVRGAVLESQRTSAAAQRGAVQVRDESGVRVVNIEVTPVKVPESAEACYLVLFLEVAGPASPGPSSVGDGGRGPGAASDEHEVARLRQELGAAREYLQSIIEQQEAANEELKSANEEVLSSNEELQSTNEELQTAKEEAQSTNEELATVNDQLNHRNLELGQVNNDLINLLSSVKMPIVMLSADLAIRRFTPVAGKVLNLIPTDVGRRIGIVRTAIDLPDIEKLALEVMDTVRTSEQEVKDHDGRWHVLRIHPYRTADNRIDGAVVVLNDITEIVRARNASAVHSTELELQVAQRTKELVASQRAQRLADRMASLGTLAAGLGHDMANLLLPVRMRLESLERRTLSQEAQQDIDAVRQAAEHLQKLSSELRLLAMDPDDDGGPGASTDVGEWWSEASPLLRNILPREFGLEHRFPAGLPALAIARHQLTQLVFNLVQNAADALRARRTGTVRVWAEIGADRQGVRLGVTDDGPGMDPTTKERCLDPFFTTKPREVSTGMGLAIVHGIVQRVGGSLLIDSEPGRGTTVMLTLPVSSGGAEGRVGSGPVHKNVVVTLEDERLREYVIALLRTMGCSAVARSAPDDSPASLWITGEAGATALTEFLGAGVERRVVVFGRRPDVPADPRVVSISDPTRSELIRVTLGQVLTERVER